MVHHDIGTGRGIAFLTRMFVICVATMALFGCGGGGSSAPASGGGGGTPAQPKPWPVTGRLEDGDLTAPGGGYKDVYWVTAQQDGQATLRLETAAARAAATIRLEVEEGSDVNNLAPVAGKEGTVGTPLELPFSVVKDKKYWITISAEPGAKCSYSLTQSSGTFSTASQWRGGAPTAWPLRGILTSTDYIEDTPYRYKMMDFYRCTALQTGEVTLRLESTADSGLVPRGFAGISISEGDNFTRFSNLGEFDDFIGTPFIVRITVERGKQYLLEIFGTQPLTYTLWQEPTMLSTPQLYQMSPVLGAEREWPISGALTGTATGDYEYYRGDYYLCTAMASGEVSLTLSSNDPPVLPAYIELNVFEVSADLRHKKLIRDGVHSRDAAPLTVTFHVEQSKKYLIEVHTWDLEVEEYRLEVDPGLLTNPRPVQFL